MISTKNDLSMTKKICFRLLMPQIFLAAVGTVNGTISGLFASNYIGASAMSAIGLLSPINLIISSISLFLFIGSQILCELQLGKNDAEDSYKTFNTNIILAFVIGLIISILLLIAGITNVTDFFAKDADIKAYLQRYLIGSSLGVIPTMMGMQLSGYLSLENRVRRITVSSIIYIVATIITNYLFVAVMDLDVLGLSLSSSLGAWIFTIIQGVYFFSPKAEFKINYRKFDKSSCKTIAILGFPCVVSDGYAVVKRIIINAFIMLSVGSIGVSAYATCNSFLNFFFALPIAMQAVGRMLMTISGSEEDKKSIHDVMYVAMTTFMAINLVIAIIIALFAEPITLLYYQDRTDAVFNLVVLGLRILPFCIPLSVIFKLFLSYGLTLIKTTFVHRILLIDGLIGTVIPAFILMPNHGMLGLYIANVISGVLVGVTVLIYSICANRRFPRSFEELLAFPESFGAPENSRIDIQITSMEDVVNISRKVQQFCLEKGVDKRRAYFASLAIEEMAGNIVVHGFNKDKKEHAVDLRVVCYNDNLILRLKDDCVPFNPAERRAMLDSEDDVKNIGIKMVYSIAKNVSYRNILGLNALTITM